MGLRNFKVGPSNGYDDRTTYSFDYKNAHFVIVNQYHEDPGYPTPDPLACVGAPLRAWIDQDLAQTTRPLKFVFGHEPAWSYCSNVAGSGGDYCPIGSIDNLNPAYRPRPYSPTGSWTESFGRHWGDSLEDGQCPAGSREAFWTMLASHNVVAHFVGHTHTYSSRLVQGDGVPRNDVSAYAKTGQAFDIAEGTWEVDNGQTHNSAGAVYVLTTVRDNVVTFEAYDQIGTTEAFKLVETWSVHVGTPPTVAILTPQSDATFVAPASIALSADAAAPGGQVVEVAYYAGSTLVGVATGGAFDVTWDGVAAGSYALTAVATDDSGSTATSAPVSIVVYPSSSNDPPVLAPLGSRSVDEETALTFAASASDPNAPPQTLTFSLINAPAGAAIDPVTGAFQWTPTEAQGPGSYRFTVRVRDDGVPALSADQTVTVTVNEVNRPPVLAPLANRTVGEQTTLAFTASASDPDVPANALTFALQGAPAGATIDPATGAFTWTPGEAQGPGTYAITVVVTDNGSPPLSASQTVTVTVTEVNQSPVLQPIGSKTVAEGATLGFAASASDPDIPANTLTFALQGAPAGATIDPASGLFRWTPTSAQVGSWTFTVKVTDDGTPSLSAAQTVSVTVTGLPDLVVSALSTATSVVAPGGSLTLANTVKNQGGAAAGSFVVAYGLSTDAVVGGPDDVAFATTRSISSLGAGASNSANTKLTVPAATPVGRYYVCALADSGNAVAERDETNNPRCTTATVWITLPDLVVSLVQPATSVVNAGATLSVTDTVLNQGGLTAGRARWGTGSPRTRPGETATT